MVVMLAMLVMVVFVFIGLAFQFLTQLKFLVTVVCEVWSSS